jgi:hypothetical protein
MRTLLLSLFLSGVAAGALAQVRPNTQQMSCNQLQRLVASEGAAVIYSGPYTYDRFVRDSTFCPRPDRLEPAWIGATDTPQCFVGYRCVTRPIRLRD